ncbi:MAG: TetR family transcriptional regulator [Actinomycetota bacterium]|nr:TetR family transcriptional regulator [Actinomycetota bacterium]
MAVQDDKILAAVVEILDADGYEAVQLREVARRAHSSLATIYKRYSNRDELIRAALQEWMDENRFAGVAGLTKQPGESLYDGLIRMFRMLFEPWEQHPGMLAAFFRVRSSPQGHELLHRGLDMVVPAGLEILADADERFISDIDAVVSSLVYGLLGRFAAGEISITDILPTLERTLFWMTAGYEASTPARRSRTAAR